MTSEKIKQDISWDTIRKQGEEIEELTAEHNRLRAENEKLEQKMADIEAEISRWRQ